jgi:hypothetical protein
MLSSLKETVEFGSWDWAFEWNGMHMHAKANKMNRTDFFISPPQMLKTVPDRSFI